MDNEANFHETTFKKYYYSLEEKTKILIRDAILVKCGISYPTFYSKLNRNKYSLLERKAIEEVCGVSFEWI